MADAIRATTPLTGRAGTAGGGVAILERPLLGKVNIRGDGGDKAFVKAVATATGVDLPTAPNTIAGGDGATICWLGPDEWQVTTDEGGESAIAGVLAEGLAGQHAAVTDVSDYYTTIRVTGPRARDLLVKGTPLDIHPRVFAPGQCAQTRLAHATIMIVQVDDAPTYDLQVRWSMAEYLLDWLEDAAKEYL
ncbi:MAG: sarcosine oxidase subunit gamma [Alphaproteobacteria bacterium]|nr:sarcosine oxidase subunit gamma [Alphaproteobacteria bacterium]